MQQTYSMRKENLPLMNYFTITLKLNRPGREKKRILDEAMKNYTKAFDYLLREAERFDFSLDPYRSGGKYQLAKWIDKEKTKKLNQFHAEPFKDSLKLDFAMTLSSYLELKARGKKVSFPGSYHDGAGNLTGLRPIFFCRYDTGRDYCLLYNPAKERYYVKLYLMNQKSARKNADAPMQENKLVHIHKSKAALERKGKKDRFIIVPLSFGTWQEQYLKQALDEPEMLKTARLVRRDDEYYLTMNLSLPVRNKIDTMTFMGVSRGPDNSVSLAVSDAAGVVSELDFIELGENLSFAKRVPPAALYLAANQLVEKAAASRSQVIVENLVSHSDRIAEVDFNGGKSRNILSRSNYQTLERILDYKLLQAGLPKSIRVSPLGIFSTCPVCGLNTKRSRSSRGMFLCISCGAVYNLRSLGSINLANRLNKYNADTIKIKVLKEENGFQFSNEALDLEFRTDQASDVMEQLHHQITSIVRDARENRSRSLSRKEYKT